MIYVWTPIGFSHGETEDECKKNVPNIPDYGYVFYVKSDSNVTVDVNGITCGEKSWQVYPYISDTREYHSDIYLSCSNGELSNRHVETNRHLSHQTFYEDNVRTILAGSRTIIELCMFKPGIGLRHAVLHVGYEHINIKMSYVSPLIKNESCGYTHVVALTTRSGRCLIFKVKLSSIMDKNDLYLGIGSGDLDMVLINVLSLEQIKDCKGLFIWHSEINEIMVSFILQDNSILAVNASNSKLSPVEVYPNYEVKLYNRYLDLDEVRASKIID